MADFAWFTKAHRFVYHHSKGLLGGNLGGARMVLIYAIGAKTKQPRPVPLQYYPADSGDILVLASNNGSESAPGWYHNLKAFPDVDIRVGRQVRRVHAEELPPERRAEMWPAMLKQNPAIADYARKAGRVLPIMRLRTLKVY